MRLHTRKQRIELKKPQAKKYPVGITTVNYRNDENVAYVIRAAACFGASRVNVIGSLPDRSKIKNLTGSTIDYVDVIQYSTVEEYIAGAESSIFCLEQTQNAMELSETVFSLDEEIDFVVGHETTGVPGVLCTLFPCIYIDMPGLGPCLNTAQTANIALYEYSKRIKCFLS